jgi:hypothetical protein
MPFIEKGRRMIIKDWGLEKLDEIQPGDRCYFFYKNMVDEWKANPHWTTAHHIYKDMLSGIVGEKDVELRTENDDDDIAYLLAWQIFFQLYVMPYELKKREENGDVD